MPHFQIDENKHFDYLQQNHFHYDSSMIFKSSNLIWPFTFNYPNDLLDCVNCQGSTRSYPGLWQFPLHEWVNPNSRKKNHDSIINFKMTVFVLLFSDINMFNTI